MIKRIIFIMMCFFIMLMIVNISNVYAWQERASTLSDLNREVKAALMEKGCPENKAKVELSNRSTTVVEWDKENTHYKATISNYQQQGTSGYYVNISLTTTEIKTEGTTSGETTNENPQVEKICPTCGGRGYVGTKDHDDECPDCNGSGKKENTSSSGGSSSGGSSSGGSSSGGSSSGGSSSGGSSSGGSSSGGSSSGGSSSGGSSTGGSSSQDTQSYVKCTKCGGVGWIDIGKPTAKQCPDCGGDGKTESTTSDGVPPSTRPSTEPTGTTPENTTSGDTTSGGTSSGSTTPNRSPNQTPSRNEGNDKTEYTPGEIVEGAQGFINVGENNGGNNKIEQDDMEKLSDTLYKVLLIIGIVIALVIGVILGIKFILGTLEEKAEVKTMVIPYIVGCVVTFGAFGIWKIIVDLLQGI